MNYNPRILKKVNDKFRLVASNCKSCSKTFFPKVDICTNCGNKTEEMLLDTRGILYSYTIARVGPLGYQTPYAFGFVYIPKNDVLVYSLLTEYENLSIGMEMELVTCEIINENGQREVFYKFKPVRL